MFKYYVNEDFSPEDVLPIIPQYIEHEGDKVTKYFNYYNSHQAIADKIVSGDRPNNKVVCNMCKSIADFYAGYLNINESITDNDFIRDNLPVLADAIRDTIITGVGYTLTYLSSSQPKLVKLHPDRTMVFRKPDIEAQVIGAATWNRYTINRGYTTEEYYDIYIYTPDYVYLYRGTTIESATMVSKERHYISYVPIVEYHCDPHYDSIFSSIISLQDAYNTSLSSYIDSRETFSNSYLVISGMSVTEENANDIINGDSKILSLPVEGSDAKYLIKDDNAQDITVMLDSLMDSVWSSVGLSNLNKSQSFGTPSGAALKLRLLQFLNSIKNIKASIKDSLLYLFLSIGNEDIQFDFVDAIDSVEELNNIDSNIERS